MKATFRNIFRCGATVALLCLSGAPSAHAASSTADERFEEFTAALDAARQTLSGREFAGFVGTTYERIFPFNENVASIPGDDLHLLYRAVDNTAFYAHDRKYLRDMEIYLRELERRGIATEREYEHMHGAYIAARAFDAAREFAAQHPVFDLEPVPEILEIPNLEKGTPTAFSVSPGKRQLLQNTVSVTEPFKVVVVAHPLCHFTQNAVKAIQSDPELAAMLEGATWLAPPDRKLNLDVFQQWNRENPDQAMRLAFAHADWPMFDSWETPTFYLFRDGALAATVTGWSPEGNREALTAAWKKAATADAYVGSQVMEVLNTKGAVEVLISFHPSPVPADLGKTQREKAEELGKAREKEFSAKLKALIGYLGKDADQLVITRTSPVSASLTATISSREMLDRIAAFPQVRAIHYAQAKNQIESPHDSPSAMLPAGHSDAAT